MAYEGVQVSIPGLEAGADLSTNQFYCVKMSATDNRVSLCDTDGEVFLGVLQDKPAAAGRQANVVVSGVTKGVAGEALTAGDFVGTDSAGKFKIVEVTNTGADIGDFVNGTVIQGAASGAIATIMLGTPQIRTEAA